MTLIIKLDADPWKLEMRHRAQHHKWTADRHQFEFMPTKEKLIEHLVEKHGFEKEVAPSTREIS